MIECEAGSTSGIGQPIAVYFAQQGVHVAINYRKNEGDAAETDELIHVAFAGYEHDMAGHGIDRILVQADVSKKKDG